MTKAYREAGFVVMAPRLRGENGQAGNFTLFYDEVDDVLAAADYLRRLPYVDAARLFVAGHSVGGTLALLAALASDRFRAAASFSGSPNQYAFLNSLPRYAALAPFDPTDMRELQMRSPLSFAGHFRCPVRLFYGADEAEWFRSMNQRTAEIAKQHKADVESVQVPGDHFGAVPEAVRQSIEFFRQVAAK